MIFVFSAAFAREYDAEYILHRPWIMLVPLGASLVSSLLLWCVLWLATIGASTSAPPFWRNYRVFLGLFWMTAPLAWLYAIPVERFLAPADAVRANYAFLGIVAAWRVFLMIRVAQVFTGRKAPAATALVIIYGYVVMTIALYLSPWTVLALMGGVRRTEVEAAHIGVVNTTWCFAILLAPVVLVWAMIQTGMSASKLKKKTPLLAHLKNPTPVAPAQRPLWMLSIASVAVWACVLPFTQPPLIDEPTESDLWDRYQERRRAYWKHAINGAEDPEQFHNNP